MKGCYIAIQIKINLTGVPSSIKRIYHILVTDRRGNSKITIFGTRLGSHVGDILWV